MCDLDDTKNYDYELPSELVAQHPLPNRSDARLLVVERRTGQLEHMHVRDLPDILQPEDALVLNNTQVVPARLLGHRTRTGGRWEGLFLRCDQGCWQILCKTRGKIQPGETITLHDTNGQDSTQLQMIAHAEGGGWIVRVNSDEETFEILRRLGRVPLPHYIRGSQMVDADLERYQTVYARTPGAVAAPTAGLHFTETLLHRLNSKGIELCSLTLHVGIDTFRPIASDSIVEHPMHREWGSIGAETASKILARRKRGGRIVAVGTTSVRVLETASQAGYLQAWTGETELYVRPGYQFRSVDALMTNFHLPRTTLLVLVRTFGGEELIRRAYEEAIAQRYRFYSYGDSMLIL